MPVSFASANYTIIYATPIRQTCFVFKGRFICFSPQYEF